MAKIGYSKVCITPPLGTQLGGHAISDRKAEGVHDDLYSRVFVFELNGEDFCIIQNDLLGLDYDFVDETRKKIQDSLGINSKNISISCIHTHSGPKGLAKRPLGTEEQIKMVPGEYDEPLCKNYQELMVKATKEAITNKDTCTIRHGLTEVFDVASNRNHREKSGDPILLAIEFLRDDGKKLLLYNFSCHPTIMNHNNHQITADYPGAVAKLLEGSEYEVVMFINGSAGDISTRFTRRESTFDEVDRIGVVLRNHIADALANATTTSEITSLATNDVVYRIALKKYDSVADAEAKLSKYKDELDDAIKKGLPNIRTYESFVEGAVFNLFMAKNADNSEYADIRLKLFKLNDLIFVFFPSELFSDLSNPLKEEYAGKLFFGTYSNGYMGYIADVASYDADTYETQTSRFQRGQGEMIMDVVKGEVANFINE